MGSKITNTYGSDKVRSRSVIKVIHTRNPTTKVVEGGLIIFYGL